MMARPRKGEGVDPDTILDAAAEVFSSRGYTGTTLEEVGRRLGITRPSLLHHHPSKQALFEAVLERDRQWAERATFAVIGPTDLAAPFAILAQFLGDIPETRQRIRLQHVLQGEATTGDPVAQEYIALRTRTVREQIARRAQAVADTGRLAPGWSPASASTALFALINGLQSLSLIDPTVDIRTAFDAFTGALVTSEGDS